MAACRRTARTRANTCLGCWESVSIYFISLTFVSFLYEPPELTSPQTTTNWPTWPKWFMISFLLFGSLSFLPMFPSFCYTKNWFPQPLLATSTPKLSGSNSSHGRSTCASAASCWSVDYFSNFFQTLTFFFPWNIQASRDSEENWQTIWRSKTVPHFNFQQEKIPIPSTRTFLSSLTHHPGATASATGCCSHPPDAPRRRQPPRPSKKRRRSKGLATWLACWVG